MCYVQIFITLHWQNILLKACEISVKFSKSIREFSVKFEMFSKSPRK